MDQETKQYVNDLINQVFEAQETALAIIVSSVAM